MRTFPSLPKAKVSPDGAGVGVEHLPEESGTRAAARAVLEGRKKGLLAILPFLGPAFIASVAYIDPGNLRCRRNLAWQLERTWQNYAGKSFASQ